MDSFGLNVKRSLYATLTFQEHISTDKILSHPEAFERTLKFVFGAGYLLAVRAVLREIKKEFDIDTSSHSSTLSDVFSIVEKEIIPEDNALVI